MRQLLVLRHAKSAHGTGASSDFDRPLAPRGRRDAPRMGRWMARQHLAPDCIVSSSARRAQETVRLLLKAMGRDDADVSWRREVYEADVAHLVGLVAATEDACRCLLLVGHNPTLEELVRRLGRDVPEPADGKLLPAGALARFRVRGRWSEVDGAGAELIEIVRPRNLEE